jgi:hypothetical protein
VSRLHALVVSLVLGAAGVVGAIAATQTMHLGAASAAPAQMDRAAVRARAKRLNTWARTLNSTLAKRPPALPGVPQFAPVPVASYGTAVPVAARTVTQTRRHTTTVKTRQRPGRSVMTATKALRSSSTSPRPRPPRSDEPPMSEPAATEPTTTPTTTTATVPAAPAAAPAPPPAPTSPPAAHAGSGGEPQDSPEPGDDG